MWAGCCGFSRPSRSPGAWRSWFPADPGPPAEDAPRRASRPRVSQGLTFVFHPISLFRGDMMTQRSDPSTAALWARFRFSVVGSLLSAPPAPGELKVALGLLAEKTWTHPVSGDDVRFAVATIERWYYTARREKDDPVGVLRRTVRKDCGKVSLTAEQIEHLRRQYDEHKHWTYQLHYDNLAAAVKAKPSMGPLRSYCPVGRYMRARGLVRKPRPRPQSRPGEVLAAQRRASREVRSYEAEYV